MSSVLFDVQISNAEISDAESLAKHVEVPAIQNTLLYWVMFPG